MTPERIKTLYFYDMETGYFWHRLSAGNRPKNRPAGFQTNKGYRCLSIDGFQVMAHRAAWAVVTGAWPMGHIDHIDGVRSNNSFCNLRECTQGENMQNIKKKFRPLGVDLPTGVSFHKKTKKFRAVITVNYKRHHLGYFDCPGNAGEAYKLAKASMHKFQNHLRGAQPSNCQPGALFNLPPE